MKLEYIRQCLAIITDALVAAMLFIFAMGELACVVGLIRFIF